MERGGSGDGVCRDGVEGSRRQDGVGGIYVWFVDGGEGGCIREEPIPPVRYTTGRGPCDDFSRIIRRVGAVSPCCGTYSIGL